MQHNGHSPGLHFFPLIRRFLERLLDDQAIGQDRDNPTPVRADIRPHRKGVEFFRNTVFYNRHAPLVVTGDPDEPELPDLRLLER